jgi:hypothetical protein
MKNLCWIAWTSLAIAVLIILLGGIFLLTGKEIFGIKHLVNYFHAANTFLLLAIALFLYVYRCECKK